MRRSGEDGAALVVALLATALLTLLAGVMIAIGRQQVEHGGRLEQRLLLELRADGALAEASYRLAVGQPLFPEAEPAAEQGWRSLPLTRWASPGERGVPEGGGTLRFRTVGLSGRVNPIKPLVPGEFERYLVAKGVAAERAAAIAAELADWTEDDQLRRLNGAVLRDYRAAGLPYAPRGDRQLQAVAELSLLRSMDPELYRRIAPDLTLEGGEVIDVDGMPEARLRALAGALPGGGLALRESAAALRAWLAALRHVNSEVILSRGGDDTVRIEVEAIGEHVRVGRWAELRLRPRIGSFPESGAAARFKALADGGRERPWTVLRWGVR